MPGKASLVSIKVFKPVLGLENYIIIFGSVSDPFHFDMDPDPRIRFVK